MSTAIFLVVHAIFLSLCAVYQNSDIDMLLWWLGSFALLFLSPKRLLFFQRIHFSLPHLCTFFLCPALAWNTLSTFLFL